MKTRTLNILVTIAAVLMVFAFMPLSMGQVYADTETITVDGVKYKLNDSDQTATVTGCDSVTPPSEVTICSRIEFSGTNYDVTSIGNRAFFNCSSLTSITIPASVTKIENVAFWQCGLTTVKFEEGSKLESIGDNAFGSNPMSAFTIPENVTSIGMSAFNGCSNLTSITIPSNVTSIGTFAFAESGLSTIVFAEGCNLQSIGNSAFILCSSLTSITIPASVTSIGKDAFFNSGLNTVEFAEGCSLESIGQSWFWGCSSLRTITIPTSVTSIGENAFSGCTSLGTITIPSGVTSIGSSAFYNCPFESINFLGSKEQWGAIEGEKPYIEGAAEIFFENEDGTVLQYSQMKSGDTPSYKGQTPTKAADAQYTYQFKDWTPEITEVTGDAIYTATYDKTAKFSFNGAKVVLSSVSLTYNGKVQKPSVKTIGGKQLTEGTDYKASWSGASPKNVGKYTVTVTGIGKYKDSAKATYKIVPKGTTLKTPKGAKRAITVTWAKQSAKMSKSRITGYKIQVATDSKFTKNKKTVSVKGYSKASTKVTKLKGGKKYYVRICTYMTVSGTQYCSPWSKPKTVKTKK